MIVRGKRPARFLIVDNRLLQDGRISFRARGLLAFMLSQPDGWRSTSTEIAKRSAEGRDAIRTAMAELTAVGYMTRDRAQRADGRWLTTVTVHDTPVDNTERRLGITLGESCG